MKTVPLHLPLRAREAAALADLICHAAHGKSIRDDIRNRVQAQISSLRLETIKVYAGSLSADPVHSAAYFIAVDGTMEGVSRPLLLRIGPAASPASALFPNPLLIGRMRAGLSGEVVVNAVPFAVEDRDHIGVFIDHIDTAFKPRPQGTQPPFSVSAANPAAVLPSAFEAFRYLLRNRGMNHASIAAPDLTPEAIAGTAAAAAWSAIRAGWRDGYTIEALIDRSELPAELAPYTTFVATPDMEVEIERITGGKGAWKRFGPNPDIQARTASLRAKLDMAAGDFDAVILDFAVS